MFFDLIVLSQNRLRIRKEENYEYITDVCNSLSIDISHLIPKVRVSIETISFLIQKSNLSSFFFSTWPEHMQNGLICINWNFNWTKPIECSNDFRSFLRRWMCVPIHGSICFVWFPSVRSTRLHSYRHSHSAKRDFWNAKLNCYIFNLYA